MYSIWLGLFRSLSWSLYIFVMVSLNLCHGRFISSLWSLWIFVMVAFYLCHGLFTFSSWSLSIYLSRSLYIFVVSHILSLCIYMSTVYISYLSCFCTGISCYQNFYISFNLCLLFALQFSLVVLFYRPCSFSDSLYTVAPQYPGPCHCPQRRFSRRCSL